MAENLKNISKENDNLNLWPVILATLLNTNKILGEVAYLIGAGLGLLIFLSGMIGSLLIHGLTKNPLA